MEAKVHPSRGRPVETSFVVSASCRK